MSSDAPSSLWTDEVMRKRVRRRYASERWFRLAGLGAVGVSVLFLAFLLVTMASKGIGGFSRYEAKLPIDFVRSDLFLDPAAIHGPEAVQLVHGANLEGSSGDLRPAGDGAFRRRGRARSRRCHRRRPFNADRATDSLASRIEPDRRRR